MIQKFSTEPNLLTYKHGNRSQRVFQLESCIEILPRRNQVNNDPSEQHAAV